MSVVDETMTPDLDVEFVGSLEEVTHGWTGPTNDGFDGDWTA